MRAQHEYTLGDLALILGKSDSTLSEIISLNKLPDDVKNDCRNEPKAGRVILALIAYTLDSATLTNSQKVSLNQTIVKMRSMLQEKTKQLKVPVTAPA